MPTDDRLAILRSPLTIRERCRHIHDAVARGQSAHFEIDSSRLAVAADRVAAITRRRYPDLKLPYHSRWRHFEAGGIDRHGPLRAALVERASRQGDPQAVTRALIDLAVVSVLLDAGAGAAWRYREAGSGLVIGRSEGLALASFDAFRAGRYSSDAGDPWRVDAAALMRLTEADLARDFQVNADNPLVGLAGRVRLMNALGEALAASPRWFGPQGRPGGLVDALAAPTVAAPDLLEAVLLGLSRIWPSGQAIDGIALGDCWPHPRATPADARGPDAGWVPFHKLSQWLTYSLIEPFEWAGVPVMGLDRLTGLPEYRNGGLLIDTGVLRLRDPGVAATPLPVGSPLVIEWRALTVALIDDLANLVRQRLAMPPPGVAGFSSAVRSRSDPTPLPLAAILEGGTWAAGRELAAELRGGEPPLTIASDGTVF